MHMQKDLREAVASSLKQGVSREKIEALMMEGGWKQTEVQEALAAFVVTPEAVAIPVRAPVTFAKESYLYLMQMLSYIISSVAFLILWFQYLNVWMPDAVSDTYMITNAKELIRTGMSMLIVALPIFFLVSSSVRKTEAETADAPRNATKQGMLYLGAFAATIAASITLMVTVYQGLSGEATVRFLLKVLAILLVCGVTGFLARYELRSEKTRLKQA